MQVRRVFGAPELGGSRRSTLVAIGNFDGVHLGHRAVLEFACAEARSQGLRPMVLTFDPHPIEVLGRGRLAVLTPVERKVELLRRLAPDLTVVVEPFTTELSQTTAREFVEQLLVSTLGAKLVVVGQNFRFGRGREGDLDVLQALGRELGFEARVESLTGDREGPYSSSRVRVNIAQGDIAAAARILGRPHALTGKVVHGDGKGRTIGVPTANLAGVLETLPPYGVYSCLVDRSVDGRLRRLGTGVVNIGERPTRQAGFSVEVHVHDFEGSLYDDELRLHLVGRLREERRFTSLEALVAQIQKDIETAREATAGAVPDPEAGDAWA